VTASRNGGKRVWPRAGPVSNSGTLLPQRGRAVTLTLVALLVTALTGAIIMDKAAVGAVPPSSVVNGSGPGPQPMNGMSRPRVVVELVIPASRPLEDPTGWIEPGTMAGAMPLLRRAVVKKGDSLYSLFRRIGLSPEDLMGLLASTSERRDLQRLVPGQVIEYETQPDGSLAIFVLHLDEIRSQRFEREGSRFNVTSVQLPVEPREIFTTGVIRDSLFLDGQRAGLSDKLIMQMAEIFGWDIDFAMDLREGDRFTVIYEALHRDGERIRDGVIVAAEFITQGRVFRAIRFDSRDHYSYYNLEGRSCARLSYARP
jgi:hypothetical protein